MKRLGLAFSAAVAFSGLIAQDLHAGDYYTKVPFLPTVKVGPDILGATPAREAYGKEYSHNGYVSVTAPDIDLVSLDDHNAFGVADPGQVVSWDGIPGTLTAFGPNSGSVDAFDFLPRPGIPTNLHESQVDAIANSHDFLFPEVVNNAATLLFSTTSDLFSAPGPGGAPGAHVHYEDPSGAHLPWALIEAPPVAAGAGPGVNHHVVKDLDGLEVWGPEPPSHIGGVTPVVEGYIGGLGGANTADSNRFSLDVDSTPGNGHSMWNYDIATGAVSPYIPHAAIVDAIEQLFLPVGVHFTQETRDQIDLDAAMARDISDPGRWSPGDELLFSIDPILDPAIVGATGGPVPAGFSIDGGEIMRLVKYGVLATDFTNAFLSHGGHLWDTAFDVRGKFGYMFEDIDALEAVGGISGGTDIPSPEPTSLVLLVMGIAAATACRRRTTVHC